MDSKNDGFLIKCIAGFNYGAILGMYLLDFMEVLLMVFFWLRNKNIIYPKLVAFLQKNPSEELNRSIFFSPLCVFGFL